MKILLIGGTGTIGQAIANELKVRHQVICVGSSKGDVKVDITKLDSIKALYQSQGKVDAVIAATGKVHFAPLTEMSDADYEIGLHNKLMGQVNLVLQGLPFVNDQGSFTLTCGILNREPVRQGSSAAMVNGAIEGFVKAAALEMPRGIRINAISPTILTESFEKLADFFRGYKPVSAADVALAYSKSVESAHTGQIYRVGY